MYRTIQPIILFAAFAVTTPVHAQETGPQEPEPVPVRILGVELERASLPGSQLVWTKVVTTFSSEEPWADGLMFSVQALLDESGRKRVVNGVVRYANIPKGNHRAVMYLSPRATARYGQPEAVRVDMFYKDEEAGEFTWLKQEGGAPIPWRDFSLYSGVLMNVLSTPWLIADYEKSPDVIAGN